MALSTPVTIRTTEEAKQLFYSLSEQSDTESNGDFFKAVLGGKLKQKIQIK